MKTLILVLFFNLITVAGANAQTAYGVVILSDPRELHYFLTSARPRTGGLVGNVSDDCVTKDNKPCNIFFQTSELLTFHSTDDKTLEGNPKGNLKIRIFSALTGQGSAPSEIDIPFKQGTIADKNIKLSFEDSHGTIQLEGTLEGHVFIGKLNYENLDNEDVDLSPQSGVLGNTLINICSMIECR